MFNNRLLVVSRAIPVLNRAVRSVWRERRPIAVLVIVAMALLIARLVYGPLDKNPVKARFEGKKVSFENADGQVVQSIEVGARTVGDATTPVRRFAAFQDVDGDGTSEAFCAVASESLGNGGFTICCWSLRHKRYLWRTPVVDSTDFPRHPSGKNILYNVQQISVGDFDADGLSEVWVSANSTSFAHLVMKLEWIKWQSAREIHSYRSSHGHVACGSGQRRSNGDRPVRYEQCLRAGLSATPGPA